MGVNQYADKKTDTYKKIICSLLALECVLFFLPITYYDNDGIGVVFSNAFWQIGTPIIALVSFAVSIFLVIRVDSVTAKWGSVILPVIGFVVFTIDGINVIVNNNEVYKNMHYRYTVLDIYSPLKQMGFAAGYYFEAAVLVAATVFGVLRIKNDKGSGQNLSAEGKQIETLKGYKDLLDSGVITQEEYDEKKKHLLNL